MKTLSKIICAGALLLLACRLPAASPTYVTKTANGLPAAPAEVFFLSDPNLQIRLVNLSYQSDTNTAAISIQSGTAAFGLLRTNRATTDTTQEVHTTSGMVTNKYFILEHSGTAYKALLVATNNATNAVFGSGGWGVITTTSDTIYQLGSVTTLNVGAATNSQNGEAIFVGNYGRPIYIVLSPTGVTNSITSAVGRYE